MATLILTLAAGGLFLMSRAFRGLIALLVIAALCAGFYNVAKESPPPPLAPVVNLPETEYVPRVFESQIEVEELPAPSLLRNLDDEQITEHDSMLDTAENR